jgi:hypothetical protein
LPTGIFDLPVPPGAEVIDLVQNTQYKVDSSGKPVGAIKVPAAFPPLPAGKRPQETTEEPASYVRWILPASAVVLLIAGGLWVSRRLLSSS